MPGSDARNKTGLGGAERRHITVMFCDLVGSSRLGAELDPEDFSELIVAYRRTAALVIERYGGFVARYVGDGILAYWGYPRASENDSLRSFAAALDLVDNIPPVGRDLPYLKKDLQIRVAIEAGICVVGTIGDAQADIVGEAPNNAALLQSHAPPNGIITTRALKSLAESAFEFADAGKVTLKGTRTAIEAYRLVGRRRAWWQRSGPAETEIIGREEECVRLDDFWHRMRAGDAGTLVIAGEPGIGKSTVLSHLRRLATADGATWREAACAPEGEQSPLQPLRDILLQDLGMTGFEEPALRAEALQSHLRQIGLDSTVAAAALSIFLDLPPGPEAAEWRPEQFRQILFETLFILIEKQAAIAPFAMAIEDAHWSDPTSREFLLELEGKRLPDQCALIFTTRNWPGPDALRSPRTMRMQLERLADEQIGTILAREMRQADVPPEMLQAFAQQCDGIPFYANQVAQLIAQTGFVNPATLPAINMAAALNDWLLARLDAAGEHKELLQVASVIGRTFHAHLLATVAAILRERIADILTILDSQGYVRAIPPNAAGTHAFRHMLLRETAYHTMLRARVRDLHGRAAKAITAEFPALANSRPDIVAGHFEAAGRSLDAFCWWARAGDRSVTQGAAAEAKAAYAKALAALDDAAVPPDLQGRELEVRASHILQAALLEGASRETLRDACMELLARAERYGDPAPVHCFRAQWVLNFHHVNRGEISDALPHADGLLAVAQQIGAPGLIMQANRFAALSRLFAGQIDHAVRHYEAALATHDPVRDKHHRFEFGSEPGVVLRAQLAVAQTFAGNEARAEALEAEAVELAKSIAHPHTLVHALSFSAARLAIARSLDRASVRVQEALDFCDAAGFAYWAAWNGLTHSVIEARRDLRAADPARLEAAGERYASFGARQGLALIDLVTGECLLAQGALEEALRHLDQVIAKWRALGLRLFEPEMCALRARAAFQQNADHAAFNLARDELFVTCRDLGANGTLLEVQRLFDTSSMPS